MDKNVWKKWRFTCPLFSYLRCEHPDWRHDRENRCYCQSHEESYGKETFSSKQNIQSYDAQVDAINEHAWEQCPLKSFTPTLAKKEALKQQIHLQSERVAYCTEQELSAKQKLREMKDTFEEKYHEKPL